MVYVLHNDECTVTNRSPVIHTTKDYNLTCNLKANLVMHGCNLQSGYNF